MPLTYRVNHAEHLVEVHGTGRRDPQRSLEIIRRVAEELRGLPGYGVLVDLRDPAYTWSVGDLFHLIGAHHHNAHLYRGGIAYVVNASVYPLRLALSALGKAWDLEFEMFREDTRAREWLRAVREAQREQDTPNS